MFWVLLTLIDWVLRVLQEEEEEEDEDMVVCVLEMHIDRYFINLREHLHISILML